MKILSTIVAVSIVFFSLVAVAAPRCPKFADDLSAWRGCMAPMRGETGTVYRGTLADFVGDSSANLLYAMQNSPVVNQPIPIGYRMYSPMVAVAASAAYRQNPRNRVWNYYAMPVYYGYPW